MFSKATEYALRATIIIAQKATASSKMPIDEVAAAIDSPPSFTAKVLQLLTKNNRVITSSRGPNGGFYVSEKARKLPAKEILKAMGEEHILMKCVLGLHQCSETKPCPMHEHYRGIKQQLIDLFETKTIGELAAEMDNRSVVISNAKMKRR